jgi:hypothetical protein
VSILLFRHGYALEHENQSAARGANVDGFIRGVQDEHGSVQRVPVAIVMNGRPREQVGSVPTGESRIAFDSC